MKSQPIVNKLKQLIRKDYPNIRLNHFDIPLTNGQDCGTLRDILEEKVDEKYYVDPKRYDNMDIEDIIKAKFGRNECQK